LRRTTEKLGAKFERYEHDTGKWIFRVEHFSRYGLLDDDEDEEDAGVEEKIEYPKIVEEEERSHPMEEPYYSSNRFKADLSMEEGEEDEMEGRMTEELESPPAQDLFEVL
jgi:hypothetical protein